MLIEAISKRAATRRNNKVKRALPLLAATGTIPGEYLTDETRERARIERQRAEAGVHWERFLEAEKERGLLAERCKYEIMELVTEEEYKAIENRGTHIFGRGPEYQLDFWRRELSRLDARFCPHAKNEHGYFWDGETCPVCLKVVNK
jgi:hypothetical protein